MHHTIVAQGLSRSWARSRISACDFSAPPESPRGPRLGAREPAFLWRKGPGPPRSYTSQLALSRKDFAKQDQYLAFGDAAASRAGEPDPRPGSGPLQTRPARLLNSARRSSKNEGGHRRYRCTLSISLDPNGPRLYDCRAEIRPTQRQKETSPLGVCEGFESCDKPSSETFPGL
jgi:hypothetical protein